MFQKDCNISAENLSCGYAHSRGESVRISSGIDFELHPGEFAALLGPNGAGKSTLLFTLCGFIPKLEGELSLCGRPVERYTPAEIAKRLSVVLTRRPDMTHTTVREVVALGRSPYTDFRGRLRDADRDAVERAMSLAGVDILSERHIDTLSDGECQRVMIAKALAQDTPVILLDEPTAFLDFPGKVAMMRLLREIAHSEGKSILLTTHDINMALRSVDRLLLLDRELGFRSGTPVELALSGTLQQYFSSPGINLDVARLQFDIT